MSKKGKRRPPIRRHIPPMERPPEGSRHRRRRIWSRRVEQLAGLALILGSAVAVADGLAHPTQAVWPVRLPILALLTAVGAYMTAVGVPGWLYGFQDLFYGTNNSLRNRRHRM